MSFDLIKKRGLVVEALSPFSGRASLAPVETKTVVAAPVGNDENADIQKPKSVEIVKFEAIEDKKQQKRAPSRKPSRGSSISMSQSGKHRYRKSVWGSEKACMLLLLKSKYMLLQLAQQCIFADRLAAGDLTLGEIQALLTDDSTDEAPFDFCGDLQSMKLQLLNEIRRNHLLECDRTKLDKRIALLIKNRGNLQMLAGASEGLLSLRKKRTAKEGAADGNGGTLSEILGADAARMQSYQHLFYLLQTEPRYLGQLMFYLDEKQMASFMDTVILTLFGDQSSPREEYLTLSLFREAMARELRGVDSIKDFLNTDSVLVRMVASYNRRKAGVQYVQNILTPVLEDLVQNGGDIALELSPKMIYAKMIRDEEVATGRKSEKPRDLTDEQLWEREDVRNQLEINVIGVLEVAGAVIDAVTLSLDDLPYGIRWICRLIKEQSDARFGVDEAKADDTMRVCSYFVWYRFIQIALVSPEQFGICGGNEPNAAPPLAPVMRKNLVAVAKVLQYLFNLMLFDARKQPWMSTVNTWIRQQVGIVRTYFTELIDVDTPEEALQLDRYMELTQKTSPLIVISLREIVKTHTYLAAHSDKLAADRDDPLKIILTELGEVPREAITAAAGVGDDVEVQMALQNRFKEAIENEISGASENTLSETKELIIGVLRTTALKHKSRNVPLLDYLKAARKKAVAKGDDAKVQNVDQILQNLDLLEKSGAIDVDSKKNADSGATASTSTCKYASLVCEIAQDIVNRASIRERQRKELDRLASTLDNLREHQKYLENQLDQYHQYLQACRQGQVSADLRKNKSSSKAMARWGKTKFNTMMRKTNVRGGLAHNSGSSSSRAGAGGVGDDIIGPFKFSHAQLKKKRVIVDSDVPSMLRGKTAFYISSAEPGVFNVKARVGPKEEELELEIDDLLEQHEAGVEQLELDHVTLDLSMTLALLNKLFLK